MTASATGPGIERRFIATRLGRIHIATAGAGFPVLLLHQTPRSWDEYRDVLSLLGRDFRAIAMDTLGFGDSERPLGEPSIELWAEGALALLDALEQPRSAIVGHHTGAAIAVEIAASSPARVSALVLSACPFVDAARRAKHQGMRVIDDVETRSDGAHLTELWARRQPFYPADDTDLLRRFMIDALRAGEMAAEGHRVVNRYRMEDRLGHIRCPTLVIAPTDDPHAHPAAPRVAGAIGGSVLRELSGGMVPLPDQMPEAFAGVVRDFVAAEVAKL
ncbi:alpha/beta fold hydrolase [Bradyrhizobium septentrionale]|uniref:Alpha/beta fold hydrolase n=1 Tax=Bradyrhizobium septentrionale TaxID=1404411 RepID=A0A974A1X7_9BRAD|nr:alpha/beta fold hydrolase [Bradyrhizobium septentrionale]UGY13491.1 alpha/beta fold hydrolase [Bradyrhizobium septentrionale]UGY22132.1 alpha/beta fold hydrolase [Bradyrhizobium septentrionale]